MSFETSKYDLLYNSSIPINEFVSIKNPTVEEVSQDKTFNSSSRIFTISTREIFSQIPEVDQLEAKYPTILSILKDPQLEKENLLGQYFSSGQVTGQQIISQSLEFWTGISQEKFKFLSNGKIICTDPEWIIDEEEFKNISDLIKTIVSYQPNEDFIAPPNMTPTRHKRWMNLFKNRVKKLRNNKTELADKILVLSVSAGGYIPIDEIRKMTYFHFCKLNILLAEKEAYELHWQIKTSPNFEVKDKLKHWKDIVI